MLWSTVTASQFAIASIHLVKYGKSASVTAEDRIALKESLREDPFGGDPVQLDERPSDFMFAFSDDYTFNEVLRALEIVGQARWVAGDLVIVSTVEDGELIRREFRCTGSGPLPWESDN